MSKIILYEQLVEELQGLTFLNSQDQTIAVKSIGLWRNQLAREKDESIWMPPAVFIEFLETNYMESSSKVYQEIRMRVRLHLVLEAYDNPTQDIDILRFANATYVRLQGKQWQYWGKMKRRVEVQDFDHGSLQDFIQEYELDMGKDYGRDERPTTPATITDIDISTSLVDEIEE